MGKVSRREFVAVATALAALGRSDAVSAAEEQSRESGAPPSGAEVEARIDWILKKYGSRLNDEQRADIRRIITTGQAGIDAMRAFPLDNSVSPATRFGATRRQK